MIQEILSQRSQKTLECQVKDTDNMPVTLITQLDASAAEEERADVVSILRMVISGGASSSSAPSYGVTP